MSVQDDLAHRFVCPKCESHGASVRTISTSGGTLSRMFNFQHNHFLAASCDLCGFTEIYDETILGTKKPGVDVWDLLFSG